MSTLQRLISSLTRDVVDNKEYIKKIKDPDLLIESLSELEAIVGNEDIKDSVAIQTTHIMEKLGTEGKEQMLNTVLYGPPGTGKTLIGMCLSKIWYALGFLKDSGKTKFEVAKNFYNENKQAISFVWLVIIFLFSAFASLIATLYERLGFKYFFFLVIFVLFLTAVFYFYLNQPDNGGTAGDIEKKQGLGKEKYKSFFKSVSREDFIAQYVGWSDKKTIELLEANTGKVLFIDEAYSLSNGASSDFGPEVLAAINRYLSENPGKIIVIMAGYRELMVKKVFDVQPGLISRFMWHFECPGYNAEELFDIFLIMSEKDGWVVKNHSDIRDLFFNEYNRFNSNARDVQKLLFFSQLEHAKSKLNGRKTEERELNKEHIYGGLLSLSKNNIERQKGNKPPPNNEGLMNLLMDKLKG